MKVKDLNDEILFEADLAELTKEFEAAKKELKNDIDVKIVMDKIKKFVMRYIAFDKKFNIKKKRITEIESTAKDVLKYVKYKVGALKKVTQIDPKELEPLEDFLLDMTKDVNKHVEHQKTMYAINAGKK